MIRVTVDTDILPIDDLLAAAGGRPISFAVVSVSERETRNTSFHVQVTQLDTVAETAVWGESEWGLAVWAKKPPTIAGRACSLETILAVISNGSFPPPLSRDALTERQRHQLRDATILEAHIREGRDIFVSDDRRAFVNHGNRERLVELCRTKILTRGEFTAWLTAGGAA